MSLRRIPGPAGKIAVDDGGPAPAKSGPPVVFLHSLAGNTTHWSTQLDLIRDRRRGVALDFRGHGRSDPAADHDYAIESLAGDVAAAFDALGLERVALVGHSLGGGVALAFAAAHPKRVERLLLVDPIGDGTQLPAAEMESFLAALASPAYAETIGGYWASISGPNPAVRERLLGDLEATPRKAVVEAFKAVASFDPKPALARWNGPTLSVVTPHNDAAFSLHRIGSGFPHRVVEGTGHWIQLDRPEEFGRTLEEFIGS